MPVGWLRQQLGDDEGLLGVGQIAQRLGRNRSTVRAWCEQGRFQGAFKLNGRDWRVPAASLTSYLNGQRVSETAPEIVTQCGRRRRRIRIPAPSADLGDWRGEAV